MNLWNKKYSKFRNLEEKVHGNNQVKLIEDHRK